MPDSKSEYHKYKKFIDPMLSYMYGQSTSDYGANLSTLTDAFKDTISKDDKKQIELFLISQGLIIVKRLMVNDPNYFLTQKTISILSSHKSLSEYFIEMQIQEKAENYYRWKSIWIPVIATALATALSICLSHNSETKENTLIKPTCHHQDTICKKH